ncbi:uncharacterized protein YALI1_D25063g [Yarrowia lipolytica]|uniref:Uncharacterized protein n=1 Tax=Yarrowia lipolytica TaxID=4952 RepID=A0A1D8NFC0_YARLL|nr:hypothetical protein YALI1_D25063g [Yarrowia lipolytica]
MLQTTIDFFADFLLVSQLSAGQEAWLSCVLKSNVLVIQHPKRYQLDPSVHIRSINAVDVASYTSWT